MRWDGGHSQLGFRVSQGAKLHDEAHRSQQDDVIVGHRVVAVAVVLLRLEGRGRERG